jgi:hypothetical protein
MAGAKGGGGRALLGLLVLGGLAAAGAWNYQRNLAKEETVPRPWRAYAEADLRAMAEAYRGEIERQEKSWKAARGVRPEAGSSDLLGERAADFEAVQRATSRTRAIRREMLDHEVALEEIERELALRAGEKDAVALHLRRLTTFD